jgi:hypothetical protein
MITIAPRDEREAWVDRAADRLIALVLSYGILAIVAYRSLVLREAAWDLLGLLVLSGFVGLAYRWQNRVVTSGLVLALIAAAVIAGVVATFVGVGIAR